MGTLVAAAASLPILLAQQGHNAAYESGRRLGQITAYVIVGVIVLALLLKLFKRR